MTNLEGPDGYIHDDTERAASFYGRRCVAVGMNQNCRNLVLVYRAGLAVVGHALGNPVAKTWATETMAGVQASTLPNKAEILARLGKIAK